MHSSERTGPDSRELSRDAGQEHDESGSGKRGSDSVFYTYGRFEQDVLAQVRRETYGEDIGQFSWITADEFRAFLRGLELGPGSYVLDVACGSGGPAIFMAKTTGCRVTGIDVNEGGIITGTRMAAAYGLEGRVNFRHADASRPLPFADDSFDAIVCIDAINHLYNRAEILGEWYRVLRPGGRFVFTDAVIVTGMLRRDEIIARSSSMGQFIFTPPGGHDRLIQGAGFVDLEVEDVTATIVGVTERWHEARMRHKDQLVELEGQSAFEDLQLMLSTAHSLSGERRLSRLAYAARKPLSG